jgi:hypothetical protein
LVIIRLSRTWTYWLLNGAYWAFTQMLIRMYSHLISRTYSNLISWHYSHLFRGHSLHSFKDNRRSINLFVFNCLHVRRWHGFYHFWYFTFVEIIWIEHLVNISVVWTRIFEELIVVIRSLRRINSNEITLPTVFSQNFS